MPPEERPNRPHTCKHEFDPVFIQPKTLSETQHLNISEATFLFKKRQWLLTSSWIRLWCLGLIIQALHSLAHFAYCSSFLGLVWIYSWLPVSTLVILFYSPAWGSCAKFYTSFRAWSHRRFLFGAPFGDASFSQHSGVYYDASAVLFYFSFSSPVYLNPMPRVYCLPAWVLSSWSSALVSPSVLANLCRMLFE